MLIIVSNSNIDFKNVILLMHMYVIGNQFDSILFYFILLYSILS